MTGENDPLGAYDTLAGGDMQDAEAHEERAIGAIPNPDVRECPVVPLGYHGPKVVFALPEGEIRHEPAAKIGQMLRTDIFACEAGAAFLVNWRDSEDKFQQVLAAIWFVRQCRNAGLWDTRREVRSVGVWPGPADSVVLHKGDEIWILQGPDKVAKTIRKPISEALRSGSGPLYRLRPRGVKPELEKRARPGDGAWVRDKLDLWRWEPIGNDGLTGADVIAGMIMPMLMGAVPPFRGHGLISALPGAGKTTLMAFLQGLVSALCGEVVSSFSEAGLRADLSGEACPRLLDEAEGSPDGAGAVERVLEMLRRMSTGEGAVRKQVDAAAGGVATQTAVGMVVMAANNAPRLQPADASRIVEMRLLPLNAPRPPGEAKALASDPELRAAIARAHELGPALLGRALLGAWRYREDVAAVKAALTVLKEEPRTADLVAMLAAGRRLLLSDEPLDAEAAREEVAFWRPLLAQREEAATVANDGSECLQHLFSWPSGLHHHDRVPSLGELVQGVALKEDLEGNPINSEPALLERWHRILQQHGMRISRPPEGPELMVANHAPALVRIFAKTKWQDWNRALRYLDALGPEYVTRLSKTSQRFGMDKQRGVVLPLTPWLGKAVPPRSIDRSGEGFDD